MSQDSGKLKKAKRQKKPKEAFLTSFFGSDEYYVDSKENCPSDPIESVFVCGCPPGCKAIRISAWKVDVTSASVASDSDSLFCADEIFLKLIVFVTSDGKEFLTLCVESFKADSDKIIRMQCDLTQCPPDDFEELEKALEGGPIVPHSKRTWSSF